MLQEKPSLPQKSCAKLKLALKSKVRCSAELYSNGEIVYFKRDNDSSWQGTAKVVFSDSVFIKWESEGVIFLFQTTFCQDYSYLGTGLKISKRLIFSLFVPKFQQQIYILFCDRFNCLYTFIRLLHIYTYCNSFILY